MRNELENNKVYYYILGALFLGIFLYLTLTAISLFNDDAQRGLPEDPGALTESVATVIANM